MSTCPNCGVDTLPDANFCQNCGHRLNEPASQTSSIHQYVPPELLRKLEQARTSRSMVGERRVVTILFCDVTGSTAMAEQLDPEEWAEIMNGAFDYLIEPVYRYEGTLARLMGDAILAFFGAPIAHEDDPQRAVLTGLEIINDIAPYARQISQRYSLDFAVRVGINTGLVVVGEIGSDLRLEYTAMGDGINLAARMEQTAQPGTVQISEETYRLVAPFFEIESLGKIEVKGKSEPVPVYRPVKEKATHDRARGIQGLYVPIVGRETELETLTAAITRLDAGSGQAVCLVGEAGMGKSRLIEEIQRGWQGGWHVSRGVSYDATHPYAQFRQILQSLLHDHGADPADLRPWTDTLPADLQSRVEPVARVLMGLPTFNDDQDLAGEALRNEVFDVMREIIRHEAVEPLALIFDDLHWADPASVDLMGHLFPLVDELPILFICASRPTDSEALLRLRNDLSQKPIYTEIGLRRLSTDHSLDLVNRLLSVEALPDSLREQILEKSEGIPFFIEEVVRTLIDTGIEATDLGVPAALQGLLMTRIDQMEEIERQLLQQAAVIGRRFSLPVLAGIAGRDIDIEPHVARLEAADLIRHTPNGHDAVYSFRHALVQEAAYESILFKDRRRLHKEVAEALLLRADFAPEEAAPLLAHHFFHADDPRAIIYDRIAADAAARLYANREALTHYTRILDMAEKHKTDVVTLEAAFAGRGQALQHLGDYDAAVETYERMLATAQALDAPDFEMRTLLTWAPIHSVHTPVHDADRGLELSMRALDIARQIDDREVEARILWNLSLHAFFTFDLEAARDYGEQSLDIARQHNLTSQLAYTLNDIGRVYFMLGQMDKGLAVTREARPLWIKVGNKPMLADNFAAEARLNHYAGVFDEAKELAEQALDIAIEINNLWGQSQSWYLIGSVARERGEIDDAIAAMLRAIELAKESGYAHGLITIRARLANLYVDLGDFESAITLAQQALEKAQELFPSWTGMPLYILTDIALRRGNVSEATDHLAEAHESAHRGSFNFPDLRAGVAITDARLALATGNTISALEHVTSLLDFLTQLSMHSFIPEVLLLKAQILMAADQYSDADTVLMEAVDLCQSIGARRQTWDLYAHLSTCARHLDDLPAADSWQAKARTEIDFIAAHISDASLRDSFTKLAQS